MFKTSYILLFLLAFPIFLISQDLRVEVRINTPALKVADPNTIKTLEKEIAEFYNNTKWTNDEFSPEEAIEASIQINIKDDLSANTFVADIYVNTGRPVYHSTYTSPLLTHIDKDVNFTYEPLTPLRNNVTGYTDNLSSILTFYAYVILGFDYDTFSSLGGDEHFKTANNIISNIPPNISSKDRSWSSQGSDRNRFWLIENLLNPRIRRFRQAIYDYHLNGLDRMYKDVTVAKAVLLSALKEIGQANNEYRNSMIIQMFSNSKRAEILEIFKNSVKSEQRQVYRIMSEIDPGQVQLLQELN